MSCRTMGSDQATRITTSRARVFLRQTDSRVETKDTSLQSISSWKGWSIGSYVHVLRPKQPFERSSCNFGTWQTRPALLIDILKQNTEEAEFLVAYLYDWNAAAHGLDALVGCARLRAFFSLRAWPRKDMYVLRDKSDLVYEWDLRIWSRSTPPSVVEGQIIDHRTGRLVRSNVWSETVLARALSTKSSFQHFLRLPPEIRDIIYGYVLTDEKRTTSTLHMSLARMYSKKRWPWQNSSNLVGASTPAPRFQILSVCRQIHREASNLLCRTRTLVVTVTSTEDSSRSLQSRWKRCISQFLRIRIDLIMTFVAAEPMFRCFHHVSTLLEQHARSMQFLEFRVGYAYANASAAVRDHGLALVISTKEIVASMGQLASFVQQRKRETYNQKDRLCAQIQIIWGVDEAQKKAGDFSCHCSYLSSASLERLWMMAYGVTGVKAEDETIQLSEQNCRHFDCSYHRQ